MGRGRRCGSGTDAMAADGTWDRVLTALLALADTTGDLDLGGLDRLQDRASAHARGWRSCQRAGLWVMNQPITGWAAREAG